MKVTIEFDDQYDAMLAMQANDWKLLVSSLDYYLRNTIKHSDKDETVRQEVRDKLHELLADYKLNLE